MLKLWRYRKSVWRCRKNQSCDDDSFDMLDLSISTFSHLLF